jgi:LysR family nitrogen assimilation transcriptional regulator
VRAGAERHRRRGTGPERPGFRRLAPGTAAQLLAIPLLTEVQRQHPGIVLYFNENFGTTLSELIMSGRMDMAVIYGDRDIHGCVFCR